MNTWIHKVHKVFAVVTQLGLATFFLTLNCVDLQWNELLLIVAELRGEVLPEDCKNDFFETF